MSILNQNLKIDLAHDNVNNNLRFHEGDVNGSDLKISVYNNNAAFDLTGVTVTFDATIAGYLAEQDHAAAFSSNVITIPITENMTALSGALRIDVKLTKSGDILIIRTITADVQRSVINDSVVIDISGTTIGGKLADLEQNKVGIAAMTDETIDSCTDHTKIYYGSVHTGSTYAYYTRMSCVGNTNLVTQVAVTSNGKIKKRKGEGSSSPPYAPYSWQDWQEVT